MPNIGDTRIGRDIGIKDVSRYIWTPCPDCGKERWVHLAKNKPVYLLCRNCSNKNRGGRGERNHFWKGGRTRRLGYIEVKIFPDDFFYPMITQRGYVCEHRLVMAKHLRRCLHSWEIIHHKNGIKDDNRIENLQLITDDRHKQITILEQRITYLEKLLDNHGVKFNHSP